MLARVALVHGESSKAVRDRVPDLTDDEMRAVVDCVDYVIRKRSRGGD